MKKIGKKWYADNFSKRRDIRKDLVDNACEHCKRKEKSKYRGNKGKISKIVLVAHHPNREDENPEAELIILCRSCHGKADRWPNADERKETALRKMYETADKAGQMQMFIRHEDQELLYIQIGSHLSPFLQTVPLTQIEAS